MADGELRYWARWLVDTTNVDGFRINAGKHIRSSFFRDWLNHLRVHFGGASSSAWASTGRATSTSCMATSTGPRVSCPYSMFRCTTVSEMPACEIGGLKDT